MRRESSCGLVYGAGVAALALLWLGGCGADSVSSLRKMPDRVYSFEVPADCATVYERIALRAQEQYALPRGPTDQHGVSARLFPSGQAAAVSLSDTGGIGLHYRLHADLHALDAARTQVDIYCGTARYRPQARLWQQWAYTPLAD